MDSNGESNGEVDGIANEETIVHLRECVKTERDQKVVSVNVFIIERFMDVTYQPSILKRKLIVYGFRLFYPTPSDA